MSLPNPPPIPALLSNHLEVRVVVFSLRQGHLLALLVRCPGLQACWELPGAPVLLNQSLEETANQCLHKWIGPHESYLEQLYTYGDPQRCPQRSVISVVYFSLIPSDTVDTNPPDLLWSTLDNLPDLVMDHAEILQYALRRLRYKLEYTAVGFELLPDQFTLSELQHTYELILGEKLDKRNFRRRILQAGVIESTEQSKGGEGRPARLFRYRADAVAEVKARRLFP